MSSDKYKIRQSPSQSSEHITTQDFPRKYLQSPPKYQELVSKVSDITVTKVANEYPLYLIKHGTATELRSKFTIPPVPTYTFFNTCGGVGDDLTWALTRTIDKCYIFGGLTSSFPPSLYPVLLVKIDDKGDIVWTYTYGGGGSEWIRTIKQDPLGGYILAGYSTSSSAGGRDLLVFHINDDGNLDWVRVIGTSATDEARAAYRTADGGIIIAGFTSGYGTVVPQPIIVKLNSRLDIEWAYVYAFQYPTYIWDFIPTFDGKFLAVGRDERGGGEYDYGIVMQINQDGSLIWAKGIYADKYIRFLGCRQLDNNNYVIGGYTPSFGFEFSKFFIVKMTTTGELVKSISFGGAGLDNITRLEVDVDRNIIGMGTSYSFHYMYQQAIMCKLTQDLTLQYLSVLNGFSIPNQFEILREAVETFDGGYLFIGYTTRYTIGGYDGVIIKTNKELLVEDCPLIAYEQVTITEVEPSITDLYPTVIDFKNNLSINTPNYVRSTPQVIVQNGCLQGIWYRFQDEWH